MTAKSKERRYAETGMTAAQVDHFIVKMRAEGHALKAIATAVGLTPSGVHRALERMSRPGRPPKV